MARQRHESNTPAPAGVPGGGGFTAAVMNAVELLSRLGGYAAAGFMLCIVVLILLEIAVRTGWDSSTQVASEYSGYFMVALVLLGFAETFRSGAFIRIELLMPRLPSKARRVCEILVSLLSLAITIYALRYSLDMTWESLRLDMRADTMAETPFWIPQLALPTGLSLLALQICVHTLRLVLPQQTQSGR